MTVAEHQVLPAAPSVTDLERAERAARYAVRVRGEAAAAERRAVVAARALGVSWDRVGRWLDLPGETLRRRYGS